MADNISSGSSVAQFLALPQAQRDKVLGLLNDDQKRGLLDTLNVRSATTKDPTKDIPPPKLLGGGPMTTGMKPYEEKALSGEAEFARQAGETGKGLWESNKKPLGIAQGMVEGIASAGASAGRELKGEPQPGRSVLSAPEGLGQRAIGAVDTAIGGDPGAARMAKRSGDPGKEYADLVGMPLLGMVLGHTVLKELPGLKDTTEEVNPQRRQIASLQRLMGRESIQGSPVETAQRLTGVQDLWKQSARELGYDDAAINKKLTGGKTFEGKSDYIGSLTRGNDIALKIADNAADIADRPAAKLIETYGKEPVGGMGEEIAQSLEESAEQTVDGPLKYSLKQLAKKVRGAKTIGELDAIKKHANKEARAMYSNIPGKEISGTASSTYAYRLGANEIRSRMYPKLQQLAGPNSGIDLTELGRREADAIAMRDGMHKTYYSQVAPEQASKEALTFFEYAMGEGPDHSFYTRHFLRRQMEKANLLPGPAGMFNIITKRGLGELGEGGGVESVSAKGKSQLALGGSTAKTRFSIPTGLPEEIVTPGNLSTRSVYQGTREVPNPEHEPFQESGSYSYGERSAGGRKRALGTTGEATPVESFTGPKSRTETVWQRQMTGEGPQVSTVGGGVMTTESPELAQSTLDRINDRLKQGGMDAESRTRLMLAKSNLEKQLRDYTAYQGKGRPQVVKRTLGQKGRVTRTHPVRRSLTGIGVTMGGNTEERRKLPPLHDEDDQ